MFYLALFNLTLTTLCKKNEGQSFLSVSSGRSDQLCDQPKSTEMFLISTSNQSLISFSQILIDTNLCYRFWFFLMLALECHKLRNWSCPSREKKCCLVQLQSLLLWHTRCSSHSEMYTTESKQTFAFTAGKMVLMAGAFDLTSCKLIKTWSQADDDWTILLFF